MIKNFGKNITRLSTQFDAIDRFPLKFYLNVGVLEYKEDMIDTNVKLRDVLIKKGYPVNAYSFPKQGLTKEQVNCTLSSRQVKKQKLIYHGLISIFYRSQTF